MTSLYLTLGYPSAVSPVDFSTLETPSSSASDSSKPNRTSSPSSSRTPSSSTTSSTTSPRTGPSSTTTSQATSGSTSNYFPSNLDGSLSGWNFFVVGILLLLLAITVLITCLFYKRRSNYEKFHNGKSVPDSESLS